MGELNHLDEANRPHMVDVGAKAVTRRTARARATLRLPPPVAALITGDELNGPKGPVVQTAIIAGIQAVKRTPDLIPMCHPLPVDHAAVRITFDGAKAIVECEVRVEHKTGVEMEALTGATVAALTFYDMCKALSHEIVIEEVRLIEKTGGSRRTLGVSDER